MLNQSFTGIEGIENIEETSAWSKEMLKSSETKFLKNRNLLLHLLIQTSPILHRIVLQFIFDICYTFMTQIKQFKFKCKHFLFLSQGITLHFFQICCLIF